MEEVDGKEEEETYSPFRLGWDRSQSIFIPSGQVCGNHGIGGGVDDGDVGVAGVRGADVEVEGDLLACGVGLDGIGVVFEFHALERFHFNYYLFFLSFFVDDHSDLNIPCTSKNHTWSDRNHSAKLPSFAILGCFH